MPRYFFDVLELSGRITRDDEGTDCADAEDAEAAGALLLASMLGETIPQGLRDLKVQVSDETGTIIGCIGVRFTTSGLVTPAEVFLGC